MLIATNGISIPFLNGEDPEILKEKDYGVPERAKSKFFGPKVGVVIKNRHLLLLYVGKKIQLLKGNGKEIEGLIYFSPRSLQRIANYDAFKPDKIHYERTHATKHYLSYEDEGFVVYRKEGGTNLFALTEKGEQYCKEIIDELILCLPEAKRPTMASKAEIQETIKPRNAFLHLEEYCKRSDIRPVLKYNRFFGRKQELNELYDFLQPSAKKIMIIFGDSGVGKTRLIMQFATQVENQRKGNTLECLLHTSIRNLSNATSWKNSIDTR